MKKLIAIQSFFEIDSNYEFTKAPIIQHTELYCDYCNKLIGIEKTDILYNNCDKIECIECFNKGE